MKNAADFSSFVSHGGELPLSNFGQMQLLRGAAERGVPLRIKVRGFSMTPCVRDEDVLTIVPMNGRLPRVGEVVAFIMPDTGRLAIHRVIARQGAGWLMRGDNSFTSDGTIALEHIIGRVTCIQRRGQAVRFGLGREGAWIAALHRREILMRIKKLMHLFRRAAGIAVRWLKSTAIYRALDKRYAKRIEIMAASADDVKASERLLMSGTGLRLSSTIEIQEFKLWDKLQAKRAPVFFDLEITARCNNNCRHCYINLPARDPAAQASELTAAEILAIGREAAGMGAMWCLLTGGEPLLREDFAELYLELKRLGLLVSVFTNACLITPAHVALFQKYPPRDIEVTVYGVTRETYEHITRQPGSYDACMRGLDLLLHSGLKVRLKAMAMQSNLHEHAAIADFCRARTKDFFRFDSQLHLRFDGDPARNAEICAERLTPEQIVALECADEKRFAALQKNCATLIKDKFPHGGCDHFFHCGAGEGSFSVSYDGRFRLCPSLWAEGTTYDVRTGTLHEALEQFVPQVRDLRSGNHQFLETCSRCELVDLCLWCPAHAHLETGMMDGATPYFCAIAHARAAFLKGAGSKP